MAGAEAFGGDHVMARAGVFGGNHVMAGTEVFGEDRVMAGAEVFGDTAGCSYDGRSKIWPSDCQRAREETIRYC